MELRMHGAIDRTTINLVPHRLRVRLALTGNACQDRQTRIASQPSVPDSVALVLYCGIAHHTPRTVLRAVPDAPRASVAKPADLGSLSNRPRTGTSHNSSYAVFWETDLVLV